MATGTTSSQLDSQVVESCLIGRAAAEPDRVSARMSPPSVGSKLDARRPAPSGTEAAVGLGRPAPTHAEQPPSGHASQQDEGALVHAAANGDGRAVRTLFRNHASAVRRTLFRLGVNEADVDDVVQQVFLELVRCGQHFERSAAVRPWLLGITAMLNRRYRRQSSSLTFKLALFAKRLPMHATPHTPEAICEHDECLRRLADGIDQLSPKLRETFVLVTAEGLSGEEAAAALGIPVASVWRRLHDARTKLKAHLEESTQ